MVFAKKLRAWFDVWIIRLRYFVLRAVLGTAIRWPQLNDSEPGYTVIIGVPWQMWDLVDIPLLSLQHADRTGCREVILAIDATETSFLSSVDAQLLMEKLAVYADLHPRLVFYTPWQQLISQIFRWNWVDCWLTWAMGMAESRTRFALLHDFDAVVIDPSFLVKHFALIQEGNSTFVGIQQDKRFQKYADSEIYMTIELMLDIFSLKAQYHPIDLFNCVRKLDGDVIVCDILRHVQLLTPLEKRMLHPLEKGQVIHPSQLISQWHKLRRSTATFEPFGYAPILILPYFRYLIGDSELLEYLIQAIEMGNTQVQFDGKTLSLRKLDQAGCNWVSDQIEALESYFPQGGSQVVKRYCDNIRSIPSILSRQENLTQVGAA